MGLLLSVSGHFARCVRDFVTVTVAALLVLLYERCGAENGKCNAENNGVNAIALDAYSTRLGIQMS